MEESKYVLFESEVASQLSAIEHTFELVEDRTGVPGEPGVESLAFQLHNLYSACEELFELIANTFENHIDPSGGYHIELLKRMRIPISGVRAAVVSDETYRLLDSLRSFRHVFRHAYGVPLDRRKVEIVLDDARSLRSRLQPEIGHFLASISDEQGS